MTRISYPAAALLALLPAAAPAQTTPPPLVPGLDNFSLPSSRPVTLPSDLPTPAPTFTPEPRPRATPTSRATPSPSATPSPHTAPTPAPTPTGTPTPEPSPVTTPSPVPTPTIAPPTAPSTATPVPALSVPPAPATTGVDPLWWLAGAIAALALVASGWWLGRRGRAKPALLPAPTPIADAEPEQAREPVALPPRRDTPPPPPAAPAFLDRGAPPASRPRLELTLLPRRGGLNMISATVEGELLVRNTGDRAAEGVRVDAALIAARSGQEAELGDYLSQPVVRPAAPPFALAPGEERRVRVVAALPLAGVEPVMAGDRPMLVPLVAARASYAWGAIDCQTGITTAVGVQRPGQVRLAPFWMDAPRMHDALAARPHALAVAR